MREAHQPKLVPPKPGYPRRKREAQEEAEEEKAEDEAKEKEKEEKQEDKEKKGEKKSSASSSRIPHKAIPHCCLWKKPRMI